MAETNATAGASGVLRKAMYGTGLGGSKSLPTLLPGALENPKGVTMEALLKFLFPPDLANSDSCGRLEVFGKYGPTDENGLLRGGRGSSHVHPHHEIKQMIAHNCRETLYDLLVPKARRHLASARSTVESIVETLVPVAMSQRYTEEEIKDLLREVPRYRDSGRLMFVDDRGMNPPRGIQDVVPEIQRKRLLVLVKRATSGKPIAPPKERPLKVPFQSEPAHQLTAITRQKKQGPMEEIIAHGKRHHQYSTHVAGLEDQSLTEQVKMNALMCRDLGPLNDRWDRYCALRRSGRSSYVNTRNSYRFNPSMDCGLGNKHPGVSSLLTASCGGSSAAALLGAS